MFNRTGFRNKQRVYIPWMRKYGRITRIRHGLISINIINPRPGQPKEITSRPHEIENGE